MAISLAKLINAAAGISEMPYPNRGLSNEYQYQSISIVAHSLGAVISRLALLYSYEKGVDWLSACNLILYAPAHFGSRLPDNFKECFTGSFNFVKAFAYSNYPILTDLKEDSRLLKELHENCNQLIKEGKGEFLKAKKVVWAENEKVVVSRRFLQDNIQDQIEKTTHVSVCKVSYAFTEAMNHLISAI